MPNRDDQVKNLRFIIACRFASSSALQLVPVALFSPTLAIKLSLLGHSNLDIGLYGFVQSFGVLIALLLTPRSVRLFGEPRTYHFGMAISSCGILGIAVSGYYVGWCASIFLVGIGQGFIFSVAQVLLAQFTPSEKIGRVTGVYQTALGLSFATATILCSVFDLSFDDVRLAGVLLQLASWGPVVTVLKRLEYETTDVTELAPRPVAIKDGFPLLVAASMGGVFEVGLYALGAVQGLHIGLSSAAALAIPSLIAVGTVVIQYPIGHISDRIGANRVLLCSIALLVVSGIFLIFARALPLAIWPAVAIWGSAGGALYTLVMIRIAGMFHAALIPTLTSLAIACYTLGSMVGPFAAGLAMDASSDYGLGILCVTLSVLGFVLVGHYSVFGSLTPKANARDES